MIKIPKLPDKEEFAFREKSFLYETYEDLKTTPKGWFIVLLVVLVLGVPLYVLLLGRFTDRLISDYQPPVVEGGIMAKPLAAGQAMVLPVTSGVYSALAQVSNPNADLLVRDFAYEFVFKNRAGEVIKTAAGESFLAQGASRFVILPSVTLSETPVRADLALGKARFSQSIPDFVPEFDILQQNSGDTDQGNFFVEGLVKNSYSYSVKKLNVQVLVFDTANRRVLAVNGTALTDVKPYESRYFRVIWPVPESSLFDQGIGQISITADVNPLDPGLQLSD